MCVCQVCDQFMYLFECVEGHVNSGQWQVQSLQTVRQLSYAVVWTVVLPLDKIATDQDFGLFFCCRQEEPMMPLRPTKC